MMIECFTKTKRKNIYYYYSTKKSAAAKFNSDLSTMNCENLLGKCLTVSLTFKQFRGIIKPLVE